MILSSRLAESAAMSVSARICVIVVLGRVDAHDVLLLYHRGLLISLLDRHHCYRGALSKASYQIPLGKKYDPNHLPIHEMEWLTAKSSMIATARKRCTETIAHRARPVAESVDGPSKKASCARVLSQPPREGLHRARRHH
jgi:hypothetical protein